MKYFIILLSFLLIPLVSCSDNYKSPLEPDVVNYNLEKSTGFSYTPDRPLPEQLLIPLPPKASEWQDIELSVSQTVNGTLGGIILLDKFYLTPEGQTITITANLVVPPGAFEGNKTITVTVDSEYAAVHFYPAMTFEKQLRLTQCFIGLDLSNYRTATMDFVFIDDNGKIEIIRNSGVQINLPQGFVRVINARLFHFSRYAFSRGPVGRIPPNPKFEIMTE